MSDKQLRIIWSVILLGACVFTVLSFLSYHPGDISFNTSSPSSRIQNLGGFVGAYLVWGLLFSIGWAAYLIPVIFAVWAAARISGRQPRSFASRFFGFLFMISSFAAIMSTITMSYNVDRVKTGGIVGFYISVLITRYFGQGGSLIILTTVFILSLLLATEFLILPALLGLARRLLSLYRSRREVWEMRKRLLPASLKTRRPVRPAPRPRRKNETEDDLPGEETSYKPRIVVRKTKPAAPKVKAKPPAPRRIGDYKLPALDLLHNPPPLEERMIHEDIEGNSRILEDTLRDFMIEAKVVEVEQGPVITRYELQPAPGVKVNKITNLDDDIALSLKAPTVNIVAPIPGKGTVGIEVPNTQATMVYLKELLESPDFQNSSSQLCMALGKEISGSPLFADLASLPHLLIAGTTGAGKTVCVNSLILSILFRAGPEEVKLLLIDPKMVEMNTYNGLPHLICPVVTDVKKAAGALDWAVGEMERRYKLLAKVGARNILSFNKKFSEGLTEIEEGENKITLEPMPYIVIIIDELADMMLQAAKEVEGSITRLAQLSRAVGIHMILATQRPSVDVITGVIKANFPGRISFRVASKVDSRTVLDMNGADKLLGKGDMLFLKPGNFKLIRAQGSLISDREIEDVVQFIRDQGPTVYNEEVLKQHEKNIAGPGGAKDEMFEEAARMVIQTGQASVSMLQRRLRLGYSRAARLIDMMEDCGIVGPFRGSKARELLVENWDEFEMMRGKEDE